VAEAASQTVVSAAVAAFANVVAAAKNLNFKYFF